MVDRKNTEIDAFLVEEKTRSRAPDGEPAVLVRHAVVISCGDFGMEIVRIPVEEGVFVRLRDKGGLSVSTIDRT